MPSPKRKAESSPGSASTKKTRTASPEPPAEAMPASSAAPDSHINHEAAIAYWSKTEPTVNGVLGGFPQVSRVDLQGSRNFIAKLRRQSKSHPADKKLSRAVDCGAGIGRITDGFLCEVAEKVDIVEPVKSFTDQIKTKDALGEIYNVGLEAWFPDRDGLGPYELIWNQWCVGQLTDAQLVAYLRRLPSVLSKGGWIIVKENLSNDYRDEDIYDDTDSSVTRTDGKFRALFQEAGLKIVATEAAKGMPKDLFPIRIYALQPQ